MPSTGSVWLIATVLPGAVLAGSAFILRSRALSLGAFVFLAASAVVGLTSLVGLLFVPLALVVLAWGRLLRPSEDWRSGRWTATVLAAAYAAWETWTFVAPAPRPSFLLMDLALGILVALSLFIVFVRPRRVPAPAARHDAP